MLRAYRAISSLQVGIALLVVLTLASLVGVIIPQGLESSRYLSRWGTVIGSGLLWAGVDHLFSTRWYNLLLGLFAVNILLCTVNRLKAVFVALARTRFLTAQQIIALPHNTQFSGTWLPEGTVDKITRFFRERHFSVKVQQNAGTVAIDARRGRIREVGSALLHLSLLPLLIGGFVGKMTGFSYMELLSPGESAAVRERPFFVRCDFFELEKNEDGDVKDYKSGLTLLDSAGDTLARKVIEVNHPLVYGGIKMYQSSYRADPQNIDNIALMVTGPLVGAIGKKVNLHPGAPEIIKGTDITVAANRFIPDFVYDMKTKTPQNRSPDHNNPALFVTMTRGEDTLFARWVFRKFGAMHHTDEAYAVSFLSYDMLQSTGLLIKENPGGAIIWFGIIFMSIGVLLVFWVARQRYWIAIGKSDDDSGNVQVAIGYAPSRDDPDSARRFEEVTKHLVATLNG